MVGNHVIENLCHPSRTLQQLGTAKVCILQLSNSFFAAQAWCVEERRGVFRCAGVVRRGKAVVWSFCVCGLEACFAAQAWCVEERRGVKPVCSVCVVCVKPQEACV